MDEEKNIGRWHVFFSGEVQGVGFRFTAAFYAREIGLTGWVRNLEDGRVEMEAQGQESEFRNLLSYLSNHPPIIITDQKIEERPIRENEKNFSIAAG